MTIPANPIVDISGLHVRFKGERNVHALNGVDIKLAQGEVLGLLGESGSGKSVTLRALLRMLPPKRTDMRGSIKVEGRDVMALDRRGTGKSARRHRVDDFPGADAGA